MDGVMDHDVNTPDVETASDDYARRFAGPIGRFFLDVQAQAVLDLLAVRPGERLRILEVGGGHGQLTPALLAAGHEVWVHGSRAVCAARLADLRQRCQDRLRFVCADLWSLPFPERTFDAVLAVRLLAHVERHEELLSELARVSRRAVVVDYPPRISANLLEPMLFHLKRRVEGNTRPFFCYRAATIERPLVKAGFTRVRRRRQFFLPMVVHRMTRARPVSAATERVCRALGLTALLGAPALLAAERTPSSAGRV
jgi:SAM-dependent methyltransferase